MNGARHSAAALVRRYGDQRYLERLFGTLEGVDVTAASPSTSEGRSQSLGMVIALDASAHRGFEPARAGDSRRQPARAVFMGTPLRLFGAHAIERLRAFVLGVRTLLIQQRDDRTGSCADLEAYLRERGLATLVEVPGNDHAHPKGVVVPALARWLSAGSRPRLGQARRAVDMRPCERLPHRRQSCAGRGAHAAQAKATTPLRP